MHRETRVVFDEIVEDTEPEAPTHLVTMYTSLEHSDFLASASQLVFQMTIDVLDIRDNVPFSVSIEHSADGQTWKPKTSLPVMAGTVSSSGETVSVFGGEEWPVRPSQRFVRLCLNAGGSVGPFAFNIVIHAVERSRITRAQIAPEHSSLPGDATLFGVRREAVTEIQEILHAAKDMPVEDRHEHLLRRLSPESHAEINAFQSGSPWRPPPSACARRRRRRRRGRTRPPRRRSATSACRASRATAKHLLATAAALLRRS
jgi:hypothetical protein